MQQQVDQSGGVFDQRRIGRSRNVAQKLRAGEIGDNRLSRSHILCASDQSPSVIFTLSDQNAKCPASWLETSKGRS